MGRVDADPTVVEHHPPRRRGRGEPIGREFVEVAGKIEAIENAADGLRRIADHEDQRRFGPSIPDPIDEEGQVRFLHDRPGEVHRVAAHEPV